MHTIYLVLFHSTVSIMWSINHLICWAFSLNNRSFPNIVHPRLSRMRNSHWIVIIILLIVGIATCPMTRHIGWSSKRLRVSHCALIFSLENISTARDDIQQTFRPSTTLTTSFWQICNGQWKSPLGVVPVLFILFIFV